MWPIFHFTEVHPSEMFLDKSLIAVCQEFKGKGGTLVNQFKKT